MKKITLLVAALTIMLSSFGQIGFGVKAGLNLANYNYDADGVENPDMRTAWHAGGFATFDLGEMFYVQPELLLTSKGFKEETDIIIKTETTVSPLLIQIPVLVGAKFDLGGAKLFVNAGPAFGFGIGGKIKAEAAGQEDEEDIKFGTSDEDNFKGTDVSLMMGAGVEFGPGIIIGAAYDLGLSNLDPAGEDDYKIKSRTIMISVGYRIK